jgi:hypothetical protein
MAANPPNRESGLWAAPWLFPAVEVVMRARYILGLALGAFVALPLLAQDSQPQSLADAARAAREAKEARAKSGAAPAKSFNDDNMAHAGAAKLDLGQVVSGDSKASDKVAQARQKFAEAERVLSTLDPMDKSTLAALALQSQNVNFPGRQAWEEKLFAAKQYYVAHCRQMLREANGLLNELESLRSKGPINRTDPHVQALVRRSLEIAQDGSTTDAQFETVMKEGAELAKRGGSR